MKRIFISITVFVLIFIGTSCKKEGQVPNQNDDRTISMPEAIEIVKQHPELRGNNQGVGVRDGSFQTVNTFTLKDKNNLNAIHAISYTESGDTKFTLVYADQYVLPVIAYGEGVFLQENIVCGVNEWIDEQIKVLEYVRENNLTFKQYLEDIIQAWVDPDEDPCEGQNWVTQNGPLLTSTWGQGCRYNNNLDLGCNGNCQHELTGCVATAMGQVMNFYNAPAPTYNWALILDSYAGGGINAPTAAQINEVATLMEDIGNAVDMDWGCNSSGANTCNEVPGAFTGSFGYASANSCADYLSPQPIITELNLNRPLMFRGKSDEGGHAWVCDGYIQGQVCDVVEGGQVYSMIITNLHMNWGWNGLQNGWYGYSNLNSFNCKQKYIKNIRP